MHQRSIVLIALAAAANADILRRQQAQTNCSQDSLSDSVNCASLGAADYLVGVCQPYNDKNQPDMNAPCNQVTAITLECMYGAAGLQLIQSTLDSSSGSTSFNSGQDPAPLDNSTQRTCICESQFFPAYTGCSDCFTAHGAPDFSEDPINGQVSQDVISSASLSYCAATNTPTVGFYDAFATVASNVYESASASMASATSSLTSSFSDPIGNSTAVSYYYTPSITGSSAWVVAQATESASNGTASGSSSSSASSTPLNTNSAGQIVPTAGSTASGTASGSASSTSSGSGAARTQEVAAVAGVIALAGFVAAL